MRPVRLSPRRAGEFRCQLATALEFVREDDVLVVTKPERLARSTGSLLDIVEDLKKRGTRLFNATSARANSYAVADHG